MDFFCLPVDIKHWTFISNLIMFYSGSFFFLISVKSKVDVKVLGWRNVLKRIHFASLFRRVCDGCQEDE